MRRIVVAVVICLLACGTARAADDGYLFQTVSSGGATVRVKGMYSCYLLSPLMFGPQERACLERGGMQRTTAMNRDPHDWLCLHVEPPEDGVLWGVATEFVLVTATGETLLGGPVLLTESPVERKIFDARRFTVRLEQEGGPYGRSRLGYIVIGVGFPEGSLNAEHGEYWAEFDAPVRFTVTEQGGTK